MSRSFVVVYLPYIVAYAGVAVFLLAAIARILMWIKIPLHLRWELYPIPHEAQKFAYGGSYLEETDWWKKRPEKSVTKELSVMIPEILFLMALKHHNPKLWLRSLPFHFGLYLVIGCVVALFGQGILAAIWPAAIDGGFGSFLNTVIVVTGYSGLGLAFLGATALLFYRMTSHKLSSFSAPADYFNLLCFTLFDGIALINFALFDSSFSTVGRFIENLVTFRFAEFAGQGFGGVLTVLTVVLFSALVAYIPLTHMSHFIGKFFAYHSIRWADEANVPTGKFDAEIGKQLVRPISWSAPHIGGGGGKTWADAATEDTSLETKE